ncbi:SAVED domain-containing protein [Stenotrophomonas sp. 2MCAF14_2]|uniref:SAVED domain-containing protein n=1 Tax=Stenotrophomonas sp. 2MCAF14_2 TaxID=3232983 RepID=UPI003F945F0F
MGKAAGKSTRGKAVSPATQREVWARGAGVCAWPGCGAVLYQDPLYLTPSGFGELAHNVAASADGPRGDARRSHPLSDDPGNLILFCPTHHAVVDKPGWEDHYPEALLAQWKQQHEAAVRVAGQHSHGRKVLGLHFRGVIGRQIMAGDAASALKAAVQRGLVLTERPVEVDVDASGYEPQSAEYWLHVLTAIRQKVRMLQARPESDRAIALFGLADMPALMVMGFALGHSSELYPFQWDRHAQSWQFPDKDAPACVFDIKWPTHWDGPVALVFSLSGVIEPERICTALNHDQPSVIHVTVDRPRLDLVQGPATIDAFRAKVASVVAQLETQLPKTAPIHVFPAMPASLAMAFGIAVKPKVSFPFHVYDADKGHGAFHPALSLPLIER